ncbi:diguanylate cyclase [Accumulibacter sp.]|uniref:diguanylate cyclase domain-containing protein n=1 Tax=Accumulibacter sp. TaxID=2053492 RepID=UPI00258C4245|nr:diguanylate cyclase [Accumulibacter sp.]
MGWVWHGWRAGESPPATDFLARYGGEEFLAVLPETNSEGALRLACGQESKMVIRCMYRPMPPAGVWRSHSGRE